jgi:hypothetical protein
MTRKPDNITAAFYYLLFIKDFIIKKPPQLSEGK